MTTTITNNTDGEPKIGDTFRWSINNCWAEKILFMSLKFWYGGGCKEVQYQVLSFGVDQNERMRIFLKTHLKNLFHINERERA